MALQKYRLTQDLKDKWIAALRSGKYKQGEGELRSEDKYVEPSESFCCLGVLCDLIDPNGWSEELWNDLDGYMKYGDESVIVGLGLVVQHRLARFNDGFISGEPKDFALIADYIEKKVKAVK